MDTDLSGLQSVAGISYTTVGNHTTYYTDSLNLLIEWNLTIDPRYEKLVFGENTPTPNIRVDAGTLNLGVKSVVNGETVYTYGTALEFLKTSDSDFWQVRWKWGLYLENGATFNAYGAKIISRLSIGWGSINYLQEVYGDIEKLELEMLDPANSQIRFDIAPGFEGGVRLYNGFEITSQTPTPSIVFSGSFIENFSPTINNGRITPTNTQEYRLKFRDMVVKNNAGQHDIYSGFMDTAANPYMDFYNLDVGTSASVRESYNPFVFSFYKNLNVAVKDIYSDLLEDVIVYVENTNGDIFSNTTNTNGVLDNDLTILYSELVEGSQQTMWRRYTKGNSASDYNNNENDILDVYFLSYHHVINQLEASMKETGTVILSNLLFEDTSITQTDTTIVRWYTQLENPQKLYDYAKWFLLENASVFGKEYLDTSLFTFVGNTLKTEYNVLIDNNATDVFYFDTTTNTITIRASQFTGDIEANTITTVNDARVFGLRNGVFYAQDGDVIDTEYVKVVANQDMSIVVDGITLPEVEVINGSSVYISGINNAKQPERVVETNGTITIDDDLIPSTNYIEDLDSNTLLFTQWATEIDLTWLRWLKSVSYSVSGWITTYNIWDTLFTINGTLTINENEKIVFGENSPSKYLIIGSSGHLKIIGTNDGNTTTSNIANAQIIHDQASTSHWTTTQGIEVFGTLELQWGFVSFTAPMNFRDNSRFIARAGVVRLGKTNLGVFNLFRIATSRNVEVDIQDFILYESSQDFGNSTTLFTHLENYSPRDCAEGFMMENSVKENAIELINFNPENCDIDTSYIATGSFYIIRWMADKAPKATVHFDHNWVSGWWITEVRKNINFTITDGETGQTVENAIIYTQDTHHETTRDYSDDFYTSLVSGEQILTPHKYTWVTDTDGNATIDKLLAYVGVLGGEQVGKNSDAREVLYKTKSEDHNYIDDFYVWSYGHKLSIISDVDLTWLWTKEIPWTLFRDTHITQTDQSIVSSYSEIYHLDELYDISKSWKLDSENIDYPSVWELPITPNGIQLDLWDLNLILDPLASWAFSVEKSTNTITIKSQTLNEWAAFNSIKTTWTISVVNGWSINVAYSDSYSDSSVTITTPSAQQTVKVYPSISDLNADTNILLTLVSDSQKQAIYRYNASLWINVYIKTELSDSIWQGSMKRYELVSGTQNTLDVSSGGDFNYIDSQLNQIKWTWFDASVHSLKSSYSSWVLTLTEEDKDSIADITKWKIEESSWLLRQIYDLLSEIIDRLSSIKWDTQKIQ